MEPNGHRTHPSSASMCCCRRTTTASSSPRYRHHGKTTFFLTLAVKSEKPVVLVDSMPDRINSSHAIQYLKCSPWASRMLVLHMDEGCIGACRYFHSVARKWSCPQLLESGGPGKNFTVSGLLGLVFGSILQHVSGGNGAMEKQHYQTVFAPLRSGLRSPLSFPFY